ncbi:hypothetical protein BOTCAL_0249g00090 [Botryotinia calthae]|uniref:Uncharacterized protein n=1 Tax=Botryotinia calthae TaxID=38488 RepID=A0A4Y8CZF8_9HELO|nr:hypothetical protein BOTCAL_0249g00090 [Botryotinia calthae]
MSEHRWKGKETQKDNTSRNEGHDQNAEARAYQLQDVNTYPAPVQQSAGYQTAYGRGGYIDTAVYSRPSPQWQGDSQAGPAPRSDEAPPNYQRSSVVAGSHAFYSTTTEASAHSGDNYEHKDVQDTSSFKDPWAEAGLGYLKPQVENRSFTPKSSDYSILRTSPSTPEQLTDTSAASYQHVMKRLPAVIPTFEEKGELPYGENDYPANWNSEYNPAFYAEDQGSVAVLWAGVYKTDEDMRICHLFDHVDLFRLMYIVTTLKSTVDCWEDDPTCVRMATELLNIAGRPYGFNFVSHLRPANGFTVKQVEGLFRIMSDRTNKNRGAAVERINEWLNLNNKVIKKKEEEARKSKHNMAKYGNSSKHKSPSHTSSTPKPYPYWSPKKLLAGLPEAIMNYFGYDYNAAVKDKKLCWEWRINYFLYREKGTSDQLKWYLPENFIFPPPVPPEARFWSNITEEQADQDEQEYIQNDPEEMMFVQKRLEQMSWGEQSRLDAGRLAREEEKQRRYEEKGGSANVVTVQPGSSSSKHPRSRTDNSSSQKDTKTRHRNKDGTSHRNRTTN